MKQSSTFAWIVAIALIWPSANALAEHFLGKTAVSEFNDSDWSMLEKARDKALDTEPDGATISWKNPETKHWGTVTPVSTKHERGTICRRVAFVNHASKRTGQSAFTYCKIDGTWKVAE